MFQPSTDPLTMEVAAATLGHLVKSGGALTADIVEFEVPSSRGLGNDEPLIFQKKKR